MLLGHVHSAVQTVRYALRKQAPEPDQALLPEQLDGWCELAEAIEYHHLSGRGCSLHSNQVEELGGSFRHAFLVVEQRGESHLLDPTFGQFLSKAPAQRLQTSDTGREVLAQLLEDGHVPWNRQTAHLYGQALGIPGNLYDKALSSSRSMPYQPGAFRSLLPPP